MTPSPIPDPTRPNVDRTFRLPPRAAVKPPDIELPLTPVIDGLLDDGTLPVALLAAPLAIALPAWEGMRPGDTYSLQVNGVPVDSFTVPDELDDVPALITLHVSKPTIDALDEGAHAVRFRIGSPIGNVGRVSQSIQVIVDRVAPGGPLLPRIVFPEAFEREGLTLQQLLAEPGHALAGVIPNYFQQAAGDIVQVGIRLKGHATWLPADTIEVATPNDEIHVAIELSTFEALGDNGLVEIGYEIGDKAGNRSHAAPPSQLAVLVVDAPRVLPPPRVPGADDGVVTDGDARPHLVVHIPRYAPSVHVGDRIVLHAGQRSLDLGEIKTTPPGDGDSPIIEANLPYRALFEAAGDDAGTTFQIDMRYDVVRDGLATRSEKTTVRFDLTLPGGVDPLPDTPENEGLAPPTLHGASGGTPNLIRPDDAKHPATARIPRQGAGADATHALLPGDLVQAYLGDDPVGDALTVDDTELDPIVMVSSSALLSHVGRTALSYRVTRRLATPGQDVSVHSPAQAVLIQSETSLPGGGKPLDKPRFVEAAYNQNNPEVGDYSLNLFDAQGDGGTPIRIYAYDNMAAGDRLSIEFIGYDRLSGGNPVAASHVVIPYEVQPCDLRPRDDATVSPPIKAIYVDVVVETRYILPITYGRATASYTASNDAGTVTASPDVAYVDVRGARTR